MGRKQAPQVCVEPAVVPVRIVRSQEIVRCPSRIWAPSHWIPEHKVEECTPGGRSRLCAFDLARAAKRARLLALIDRRFVVERERLTQRIRDEQEQQEQEQE